jgi:hypothetical protein
MTSWTLSLATCPISADSFAFRLAHGALNFRLDGDLGESAPKGEEGEEGAIESVASLCLRLSGFGGMAEACVLCWQAL